MKVLHYKDAIGYELAVSALAANEGDLAATRTDMRNAGYEISEAGLATIVNSKSTQIVEARQQMAPELERLLTADLLDESTRLTTVIGMAVQRTEERLVANTIADPAKVARDLSQIRSQAIEKKLSLEGRPEKITESRSPEEIVRALEGLGVARQVTIESTAEEVP